jgi:hypothetical protein
MAGFLWPDWRISVLYPSGPVPDPIGKVGFGAGVDDVDAAVIGEKQRRAATARGSGRCGRHCSGTAAAGSDPTAPSRKSRYQPPPAVRLRPRITGPAALMICAVRAPVPFRRPVRNAGSAARTKQSKSGYSQTARSRSGGALVGIARSLRGSHRSIQSTAMAVCQDEPVAMDHCAPSEYPSSRRRFRLLGRHSRLSVRFSMRTIARSAAQALLGAPPGRAACLRQRQVSARCSTALSGAASGVRTIGPASPPDRLGPRRSGQAS